MDWQELNKSKVDDLRELAKEKTPDVTGVMSMKKDALVEVLAEALGIERPHKVITGLDKGALKAEIRELKTQREQALADGDKEGLRRSRRKIHRLKRRLRRAARLTG